MLVLLATPYFGRSRSKGFFASFSSTILFFCAGSFRGDCCFLSSVSEMLRETVFSACYCGAIANSRCFSRATVVAGVPLSAVKLSD